MKTYYIDFACWRINANNPEEAYRKAKEYIKEGRCPVICSTDQVDEIGCEIDEVECQELD